MVSIGNAQSLARLDGSSISGVSLIDRFDAVCALYPDRPALVAGGTTTTYRQLQRGSMVLAGSIDERVGDGRRPVAILLGHRPEAIAALLAVARRGRPFVGLDPTIPLPRLEQMQRLGGAETCFVDHDTGGVGNQLGFDAGTIDIGSADDSQAAHGGPADRAEQTCILFTSGSTGEPKGIIWGSDVLMKDTVAGHRFMHFQPDDRVALVLPFSFAAGLSVVAWGVTSGAALHLFDPRRNSVSEFADWIERSGCTTLHTTPTLLRALIRGLTPGRRFADLRVVTTCGEPVRAADVEAVRAHVPSSCEFFNWTGSTEVGVLALHRIGAGDPVAVGVVPAGEVVDGIDAVIEPVSEAGDAHAETGPVGELVVSGSVALGYCGNPEELALRFTTVDGRRSYRTGDLATFASDGTLLLKGRRDAAVKIRGYLVEPAEVEVALLAADHVGGAHVVTQTADGQDARLIAYVVAAPGSVLSVSHLRGHLRQRLPTYMVPSSIVVVAEFPRTDRGKVDTALLQQIPIEARGEHRAPQSDWEITVAEIWQQVLSVDAIGLDDDFFELGGDSLAVEEVLSVLAGIGPDLPSSVFIEAPTVEALARRIANAGNNEGFPAGIVRLRRGSGGPTVFCFAGAGGVALVFEFLARNLEETFAIWGVQMRGLEARGLPEFSVEQAARRFITELPALQPNGPYVLCGHSYGGLVAYEVARRLCAAGQEVKLLALFDSYLPRTAVGQDGRPPGEGLRQRVRTKLDEWESLLPDGQEVPRWRRAWQMIAVGPLRYPGLAQFDILFNRGHAMTHRYRPEPYSGPAVVYMAAHNILPIDHLGWESFLTGPWELVNVPGDHHTMLREPHVRILAADLNGRLHATEMPAE